MSDTLDLINTVRLHDNAITNQNRDLQYDLDRRADRIARKTGHAPLDWDEFNQKFAPVKENDWMTHALNWSMGSGIVGAVLVGIVGAIQGGLIGGVVGAFVGGLAGGIAGSALSFVDDQKPEIRQKQLGKYKDYLDDFERSAGVSRLSQLDETTKWREHADQSRINANDLVRT